jgi:2-polyprenyl-6-methoxyphenol hydroxylase-like FAD-dependent oxidoreductase
MPTIGTLAALFSTVRAGVLFATLLQPDQWWFMTELARHLEVTPSSLQRELESLVASEFLWRRQFSGEGRRTPELLEKLNRCRDFYFDKIRQIRMPSWTKGRVALVGDAGYCASPAAGMGGSLAIVGATALADAGPALTSQR